MTPPTQPPEAAPVQTSTNPNPPVQHKTVDDFDRQLDDTLREAFSGKEPTKNEIQEPAGAEPAEPVPPPASEKEKDPVKEPQQPVKSSTPTDLVDPQTIAEPKDFKKSNDAWKTVKSAAAKNFEIANKRAQENEEIKKTFAGKEENYKKEIDGLKKQVEELSGFRAIVDIQADPDFISKYEQPIEKLEGELRSMLKGKRIGEDVINMLDFSNSEVMARVIGFLSDPELNPDSILAKRFSRRAEDLIELYEKKGEELDKWKTNHKELMAQKKQESMGRQAQTEGQMLQIIDKISSEKDDKGNSKVAFLSKMDAPANATKDQLKQIEDHNTMVDQMHTKLKQMIKADSPEDKVEIAISALGAFWLHGRLQHAIKERDAAIAENKRIAKAGSESDSHTAPPARESKRPTATDPSTLDLDNALQSHFGRSS